jgi:hypothetical protein
MFDSVASTCSTLLQARVRLCCKHVFDSACLYAACMGAREGSCEGFRCDMSVSYARCRLPLPIQNVIIYLRCTKRTLHACTHARTEPSIRLGRVRGIQAPRPNQTGRVCFRPPKIAHTVNASLKHTQHAALKCDLRTRSVSALLVFHLNLGVLGLLTSAVH